ncbi:MAG: aminotransferase class V-fold PLP-dependent enzyme [Bacteroidota bacterium]
MSKLEQYFSKFRKNIIGINQEYETPYGKKKMIYADWVASGRLYKPIEDKIIKEIGPFVGNTHSESTDTGKAMTLAYHRAKEIIKAHVNASKDDVIITAGFGMTAVINKMQRMMGLKFCGRLTESGCLDKNKKPVVFVTHLEHHSNHTSWYETSADVVVLEPDKDILVDPSHLVEALIKYKDRPLKIGSFSACSNVTGIMPPIHTLAKIMHEHGGFCFADYAASAPYVEINMHPKDPMEKLDAVFLSPHKFLGGPGTSGVMVFDENLYHCKHPDQPGGGTVDWTNRWGEYKFIDDIELREDGGTPGFLQAIKTALCIKLKEEMGVKQIHDREQELVDIAFAELPKIPDLHILADNVKDRLGIISFYIIGIHYNLLIKLLNDRFGIQMRGGCSCAGTYGHFLLEVDIRHSKSITNKINKGDLSSKPGWVRLSLHPTMTDEELYFVIDALKKIRKNIDKWEGDYNYSNKTNEFYHKKESHQIQKIIEGWF